MQLRSDTCVMKDGDDNTPVHLQATKKTGNQRKKRDKHAKTITL